MRLLLCGQRSFGAAVFDRLRGDGHELVAVASPLEHDGRPDPLTARAVAYSLPWTERLEAAGVPAGVDLVVAAHSHAFVSQAALRRTRLGGVGYHPSLLPRHRGRDAVTWTIKMRDAVAGGTVYWLTDRVDGGPIAAQRHVLVRPRDDASSLWGRELFPLGVELLAGVVAELARGRLVAYPQDEACATWEPSIGRPPLYRPDLLRLGAVPGMRVVATALEAAAVPGDLET